MDFLSKESKKKIALIITNLVRSSTYRPILEFLGQIPNLLQFGGYHSGLLVFAAGFADIVAQYSRMFHQSVSQAEPSDQRLRQLQRT